jgi:hypothetical protein
MNNQKLIPSLIRLALLLSFRSVLARSVSIKALGSLDAQTKKKLPKLMSERKVSD